MASDLRWTITELGERAAAALVTTDYDPPNNRQVRAVPDLRTVRYYMSLGLLDAPLEMRGRTGLYGRKHLLQLVAIKRLQQEGLKLGEVQSRLTGLDERGLAKVAQVPPDVLNKADLPVVAGTTLRGSGQFWAESPALVAEGEGGGESNGDGARSAAARQANRPITGPAVWVAKVHLAPGVDLHVETRSRLDADALRQAAAPLLEELGRSNKKEE